VLKQKLWIGGDGLPNNLSIGTPSLFSGRGRNRIRAATFARWTRMEGKCVRLLSREVSDQVSDSLEADACFSQYRAAADEDCKFTP